MSEETFNLEEDLGFVEEPQELVEGSLEVPQDFLDPAEYDLSTQEADPDLVENPLLYEAIEEDVTVTEPLLESATVVLDFTGAVSIRPIEDRPVVGGQEAGEEVLVGEVIDAEAPTPGAAQGLPAETPYDPQSPEYKPLVLPPEYYDAMEQLDNLKHVTEFSLELGSENVAGLSLAKLDINDLFGFADSTTEEMRELHNAQVETYNKALAAAAAAAGAMTDYVVEYAIGDDVTPPTTGWEETVPDRQVGEYIWVRTTLIYGDGQTKQSLPSIWSGADGIDGAPGADGVGIASTEVTYAQSTSGTTAPSETAGWSPTVPTLIKGRYLWTRSVWTYTDDSTETGYSVAYVPQDGADGDDGLPGAPGVGITGTDITYAQSTSGTTAPTSGWVSQPPSPVAGRYVWTKTVWTYSNGDTETGYSVGKIGETGAKGDKGDKGDTGADGAPGAKGVGIASTAITYAQSTSDTTAPTSGWSGTVPTLIKGRYLWTRSIWTYTDDSTETGYSVAYVPQDGADGDDGLPGAPGVGITDTTITYAQSTSGTTAPTSGWAAQPPSPVAGRYVWTKTVWTYSDNSTETGYSVGKIGDTGAKGAKGDTGNDGAPGAAGVGLKSTEITYAQSTSGTVAPTSASDWQSTVPTLVKGRYLWTRSVWTYTDNSTETGYSVAYVPQDGADGDDGLPGAPGVGITNTAITYAQSTSGTTAPTSGWQAQPPSPVAGRYVWTKTVWTYSNGNTETGYAVGKIGDTGSKGDTGATGVSVTGITIFYRLGTTTPTPPTGTADPAGWSKTQPAYVEGQTLYRTERISYSNNTATWTPVSVDSNYKAIADLQVEFAVIRTSANGLNSHVTSTDPAPTTETINPRTGQPWREGDTWHQWDNTLSRNVVGQWSFHQGVWRAEYVSHQVISSVDVNKLTVTGGADMEVAVVNHLFAQDAFAKNLLARRIVVGDISNYFVDKEFLNPPSGWTKNLLSFQKAGTSSQSGGYQDAQSHWIAVDPGDVIISGYYEERTGTSTGETAMYVQLRNATTKVWGTPTKMANTFGTGSSEQVNHLIVGEQYDMIRPGFFTMPSLPSTTTSRISAVWIKKKVSESNLDPAILQGVHEDLEDVTNPLLESVGSMSDSITSMDRELRDVFIPAQIEAANQYTTDLTSELTTQLGTTNDNLSQLGEDLEARLIPYEQNVIIDGTGISLSQDGSPFSVVITSNGMYFKQYGADVAYVTNNKLMITHAEILETLVLGKFEFKPRLNGNLSLVRRSGV